MKAAVRGIVTGLEESKKYPELIKNNFVLLNVYTTSVADEHNPRGPAGPYQFKDKSVPCLVIKQWDGKSLVHQLGWVRDKGKVGRQQLTKRIDEAISKNGPIVSPKHLAPLSKALAKGKKYAEKKKLGSAYKQYEKAATGGDDKKKFPGGPPPVAVEAKKLLDAILTTATERIEQAKTLDKKKAVAALKKIKREFRGVTPVLDAANAALKELAAK